VKFDQALFLRIAFFLFLLWAVTRLTDLILWVFLAFTLAAAVEPLTASLARRLGRGLGVTLTYLGLLAVVALGFWVSAPVLVAQFQKLYAALRDLPTQDVIPGLSGTSQNVLDSLLGSLASGAKTASGFLFRAVGGLADAALALVLAVMVSLEPFLVGRLARYLPGERWAEVLQTTWGRMGLWARAQLAVAVSFALLFGLWLTIIGTPTPWALAVLGGVLEVMPFVGGATIALLATIISLSKGLTIAGLVLVGYAAIALLQGKLLIPLIYGRILGYHPATVLLAIFVGGKLFGFLGIFLAVPGFILVENLYRYWFQRPKEEVKT